MTPRIRVPAAWQFGAIDIGDARPGAVQRSIVRAVQQELFPAGGVEELAAVAERFRQALAGISARPDQETLDVLVALGLRDAPAEPAAPVAPADPEAPAASVAPADAAMPPQSDFDPVFNALCLTLHGLSLALAGPALTAAGVADDAPDAVADDDERAQPVEEGRTPGHPMRGLRLCVDRTAAETIIARLLPKWTVQHRKLVPGRCWLVAKVLLKCAVQALAGSIAFGKQRNVKEGDEIRTRQDVMVVGGSGFGKRLERMLAAMPYRFTMQPLAQPAHYTVVAAPAVAHDSDPDSFVVRLIGYRRVNASLERFRAEADAAAMKTRSFRRYVAAVNAQQAVAWRINRRVLATACTLAALVRERDSVECIQAWQRAREAGLSEPEIGKLLQWVGTKFYSRIDWTKRRGAYRLPGDLLDHPLARSALDDLAAARDGGEQPAFHLPWKADYRGRIYAETPWLTPQGGDLQRALFEFAHGRALDDRGVAALRRHGGNLASRAVVVKDLRIDGSGALTLEQREAWVMKREPDILRAADEPLAEPFWREASGDPMQFLAFCFAYAEWKRDPRAPVHAPVQIDGTCNGLQHIAAITGSQKLAEAVNVVAKADGLPGDIYSELAAVARARIGQLRQWVGQTNDDQGMALADDWLSVHSSRHDLIGRNLAKQVVMTVAYGAGLENQARDVLEGQLIEFFGKERLTAAELEAAEPLLHWAQQSEYRCKVVEKRTKDVAGTWLDRQRTAARGAASVGIDATLVLLSFLALALVKQVRLALSVEYPEVDAFSAWLRRVAKSCAGVPLCWSSPLQFPVCQNRFKEEESENEIQKRKMTVRVAGEDVSVGTTQLPDTVNVKGQEMQFLPNLIHSLDSTHLAMTIERVVVDHRGPRLRDFGSIHDCVLCHPNDADQFGEALRTTFAELYARATPEKTVPVVIQQWARWMELLHDIASAMRAGILRDLAMNPSDEAFDKSMVDLSVLKPARSWQAVAAEVTDLSRRLRDSPGVGEEAAMQAWLTSLSPHLERGIALRAWCDQVERRSDEQPGKTPIGKEDLTLTRLALAAAGFDPEKALAAEAELEALASRLGPGVKGLQKAHKALARCHAGVGIEREATKQAADPDAEMPSVQQLLGPDAARAAPWVADCLLIEAALLRHETRLRQEHHERLAALRTFQTAIGVRRLREAAPADGGDPLLAVMAGFALDYRVDHPRANEKKLGANHWPQFKGRVFDVARVTDSRYFFN